MQYNRLNNEEALAQALKGLQKDVKRLQTKPIGTLSYVDEVTGEETIIGTLPDGSTGVEQFVGDTTPPPVTTAPFVSAQPGQFVVSWDGLFLAGAEKPRDFVHVNVIGHKMNGATTLLSAPVGVIRLVTESVLVTLDVAGSGEYWQFSLESEDYNGNKAAESARSASFMMLDAISPVSEAWTDLNAEVLSAKNASVSAQAAADDAQDAADLVAQNLSSTAAEVTAAQLKADQAFNLAEQAAEAAGDAQTASDGKAKTWTTETEPAGIGHSVGDMWFDPTNEHRLSIWDGSNWITAQDAWLAKEIAESKGRTYTQAFAPPVEARLPQNLWIDTTAGVNLSVTKYWDATAAAGAGAWVPVKDAEINAAEVRAANDAKAKADAAAIAAINAQAYSLNASFDDWTGALPAYHTVYGTGNPTKETTIVQRGAYAVRFNCTDTTTDRGLNWASGLLSHAPNLEYFTVEVSFYLASGASLNGAGVLLDWLGMTNNRATLSLAAEVPTPVTGKWYNISKTLRRPTNATGTWTSMDGFLMANYNTTALGSKAIKDIIFDWMNIRPATAEEILAYNAPTTTYVDQAEADAILAASNDATTKATNAQNAAIADTTTRLLTKNKTVWSTSPATGTTGYIAGDTWFQRDGTGAVIAQWEFTTSWQPRTVSEDVIGNLSAGKIIYGTMSGDRIDSNTITSKHIFIGDFENLSPELGGTGNWSLGAVTVDNAVTPFEDAKMLTFATPNVWASAVTNTTTKAKVSGGDQLAWSYRYKKAGDATASGTVSLRLLFEKADGTLLQRLYLTSYSAAAPTGTYVQGTATVYDGSSTVRLEMVVSGASGTTSPTYVGDIKLRRMTAGNLIVDGALDAKTITGPTIQTEATALRGIKLTPTEFMGYDGTTGNKAFSLTSAGTLSLKGAISSGSTITGATIVGDGIETTATPLRGVKMNSLGIKAYDGNGDLTFSVNASTGEVEAPGIKANSIKGDKLEAGSVTSREMRIGDFTNLVTNGYGDLGAGIGFGTSLIYETTDKPSSVTGVFKSTAGQGTYGPTSVLFDVDPSSEYVTEIWLKASLPNSRIYIELRDQAGVSSTSNVELSPNAGVNHNQYLFQNMVVPTAWTKYTIKTTTGATTTKLRISNIYFNHVNGTERNAVVSLAISVRRRVQGTLLVDGSIKTNHMASGTIDAAVLVAASITGAEIKGKAITTDKLIISSTDNLILEADFGNNGSSWGLPATNLSIDATAGRGSTKALKITGTALPVVVYNTGNKFPIPADARFRGAMWVKSSIATVANTFKIVGRFWTSNIAYTDIDIAASPAMLANTYTKVEGMVPATIPDTAWAVEFYIRSANTSTTQVVHVDYVSVTRASDGNLIVDGAITAEKLETELVLTTKIIAGDPAGTRAEMAPDGFRVYAKEDPNDPLEIPHEAVRMGTVDNDYFAVIRADGTYAATMSEDGLVSADALSVTNDIEWKGESFTAMYDALPKGLLAWGSRASSSAYWANENYQPFLSLTFDAIAGRAYRIWTGPIYMDGDATTALPILNLHWAQNSTTVSTSSERISQLVYDVNTTHSGRRNGLTINRLITPSVTGPVSLLLSYGVGAAGLGRGKIIAVNAATAVIMSVEDIGFAPPETGESPNGSADSATTNPAPPPAKINYVKTYYPTGTQSYTGTGAQYEFNTGYLYSGLSPAGYGDLRSMAMFSSAISTDVGAGTITKVRVYAYYDHWYYNSGGTADITVYAGTALPATLPTVSGVTGSSSAWPKPGGRWVTVPSSAYAAIKAGTSRGIMFGGKARGYLGYGFLHDVRLEVSYTK